MKKRNTYILFILVVIVLLPVRETRREGTMPWQRESGGVEKPVPVHDMLQNHYSDLVETRELDRAVARFMKQWHIVGASLAITRGGKLVYSKGYGHADREAGIPVNVNNIFRVASISKLITAAGIMKLVEEKRLALESVVFGENGILDDTLFSRPADRRVLNITVEHLLRHQGGFPARHADPMFNPVEVARRMNTPPPADLNTIIRYVLGQRLGFAPGSSSSYSNVGYGILTRVIEKVSGQDYETFTREKILVPAGCHDMHLGRNLSADRYHNEVRYYEPENAGKVPACTGEERQVYRSDGGNNIEELLGAGGWVASPTELARLLLAIDGDPSSPDVLSPESVESMTRCRANALPIGWTRAGEDGEWWRTGTLAGTSAMMKRQGDGVCWVFVTNTSTWAGARFPYTIDHVVTRAIDRVEEWPERDLLDPLQRDAHRAREFLAGESSPAAREREI
ncbi:MAG: beta-lactamase family protein [Odoribacteraceae bacterium]|jgi:CubicO group peptidase (beta-lactamase class C family)|nr:beta-lactamase family protein [Odoribacteraceae bacterium]